MSNDQAPDRMTSKDRAIAIARHALRRLSLIDEIAGTGQRDDDPELIARCAYAKRALRDMEAKLMICDDCATAGKFNRLANQCSDPVASTLRGYAEINHAACSDINCTCQHVTGRTEYREESG